MRSPLTRATSSSRSAWPSASEQSRSFSTPASKPHSPGRRHRPRIHTPRCLGPTRPVSRSSGARAARPQFFRGRWCAYCVTSSRHGATSTPASARQARCLPPSARKLPARATSWLASTVCPFLFLQIPAAPLPSNLASPTPSRNITATTTAPSWSHPFCERRSDLAPGPSRHLRPRPRPARRICPGPRRLPGPSRARRGPRRCFGSRWRLNCLNGCPSKRGPDSTPKPARKKYPNDEINIILVDNTTLNLRS